MELKLVKFIREHNNWEELLQKKPYYLTISRDEGYILFKYNQLNSDFSNEIVQEARGIILREKDFSVVCFPFTKFFSVDEQYAAKIDWNTARVQEKIDGSLIKVWFDKENGFNKWHISTNGVINAFKCETGNDFCPYKTFGELFMSVCSYELFNRLDKNCTYMFELVSPWTKIVVSYPRTKIYHLGTRNNITGEELITDIGVTKPQEYDLKTEEQVKKAASELSYNEEGYVVVDKNWNRVKIKSPEYVNAHRLINNKIVNTKQVLDLLLKNEQGEFLSYFPEYKKTFDNVLSRYNKYKKRLSFVETKIRKLKEKCKTKKQFAKEVSRQWKEYSTMAFMLYDGKIEDYHEYLMGLKTKEIVDQMNRYEDEKDENKLEYKKRKEDKETDG